MRSKAEVGGKEVDETGPHGHHPGAMAVTSQALGTESSLSGHFSEERGIFPPQKIPTKAATHWTGGSRLSRGSSHAQ